MASTTTTLTVDDSWFIRLDGRYANGDADYESSGTGSNDNLTDWYTEIRALFGTDYTLNDFVLAPYSGLGYRYLFNDLRGDSSSGAIGYRRESEYFYLPLGVIQRVALDEGSQLENNPINAASFGYIKLEDKGFNAFQLCFAGRLRGIAPCR